MVFQKSGLPIFSKCFGNFCKVLLVDDALLSGFLSTITTMTTFFGKQTELNAVEMGYTKLIFNYTLPTGHVIVLGFKKENIQDKSKKKSDELFSKINELNEIENKGKKLDLLSSDEIQTGEKHLLIKIINPWIHFSAGSEDHTSECPMSISSQIFRGEKNVGMRESVWKRLIDLYNQAREMFKNEIVNKRDELRKKGLIS